MKKVLIAIMLLGAGATYAQEITMPDDKREQYVKEREQRAKEAREKREAQQDVERERLARERAQKSREAAAAASRSDNDGNQDVFCIIQETFRPGEGGKSEVTIIFDSERELLLKTLPKDKQKLMSLTLEKQRFSNGMEALGHFTRQGWRMEHSTVYPFEGVMVREYLMKL